jgi:hypothetical protein
MLFKGASKFSNLYVRVRTIGGGVQWDGRYFVVASYDGIFRLQIQGSKARVVQKLPMHDLAFQPWIWVRGDRLVATHEPHRGSRIAVYKYPAGGQPVQLFSGFTTPLGLTVSVEKQQ